MDGKVFVQPYDMHSVAVACLRNGLGRGAMQIVTMSWTDALLLADEIITTAEKIRDDIKSYAQNNPHCECDHCEKARQLRAEVYRSFHIPEKAWRRSRAPQASASPNTPSSAATPEDPADPHRA